MIASEVATLLSVARGGFSFWAFLLSKHKEKAQMNVQEMLQQFEVTERQGEKIQHVLIGSPKEIDQVRHTLHAL